MVPPDSHRVSRAPRYSGYHYLQRNLPVPGYHRLRPLFPKGSSWSTQRISWSYNPNIAETTLVWTSPLSLATTNGITLVFSSSAYLDVSVQRVSPPCGVTGLQPAGLPHSDIRGSTLVCRSPRLFAAYHVLLRLWEPRHPPYALLLLVAPVQMHKCPRNPYIFYSTSCFFFDFAMTV